MSDDNGFGPVECPEHGSQQATFVCRHLVESLRTGQVVGYVSSADDPDEPRPDAWCSECEKVRLREGGDWNDVSEGFAQVTLLCGACYDRAKVLNS